MNHRDENITRIRGDMIYANNCEQIGIDDRKVTLFSSPFIAAIATRVLQSLPKHPHLNSMIKDVESYFTLLMRENILIGFAERDFPWYDIDTLANVYGLLYQINPTAIDQYLGRVNKIILSLKDNVTGAYYTWVNRRYNNIDYMVNVNIFLYFMSIDYYDKHLYSYLNIHLREFLENGSFYYRDITFPVLYFFILRNGLFKNKEQSKATDILDSILEPKVSCDIVDKLKSNIRSKELHKTDSDEYLIKRYFNSHCAIYRSKILDRLLRQYFQHLIVVNDLG